MGREWVLDTQSMGCSYSNEWNPAEYSLNSTVLPSLTVDVDVDYDL